MSTQQPHPFVRRGRGAAPANSPSPPAAFEIADETVDGAPEFVVHPDSYVDPRYPRWNLPLCVLEEIEEKRVRQWDEAEADLREIVSRRVILQKWGVPEGGGPRQWNTVSDLTRPVEESWDDHAREWVRERFGPGGYMVRVYQITAEENGTKYHPTRVFRFAAGAPVPAAAVATKPAPSGAAAPPPIPMGGGVTPPQPTSFLEWVQFTETQARIANMEREREERAEERRRQREKDEEDRRDREEERRRARARDDEERDRREQERRDREEERRRQRERDEDERREREEDRRERKLRDLELRQHDAARLSPVEQIKQHKETLLQLKDLITGDGGDKAGTAERIIGNLAESLGPHWPKILDTIDTIATSRGKIAHLETVVAQIEHQRRIDPRVRVSHAGPPPPRPPDVVPPGAPCPDCGKPVPCEHYDQYVGGDGAPPPAPPAAAAAAPVPPPAESGEDADEEEDLPDCELCPECKHGPEHEDDDGECKLCGRCPHEEMEAVVVTPEQAAALRNLPPDARP